ncbi:AraC family transcriptional regulator [Albimonas pacifica]|uniref:AraC family transcriptional regulator n=1 Tax=Albimonas pacifica TaxID=1114924 RepID=UPI000B83F012|nr:AraC family transcriptional regulator [Albimonas pacifica]
MRSACSAASASAALRIGPAVSRQARSAAPAAGPEAQEVEHHGGLAVAFGEEALEGGFKGLQGGGELRRRALPESNAQRVARAIPALPLDYSRKRPVERLAAIAGRSPSSFHRHFKARTATTPLRFRKRPRLLEARRLRVFEAATVGAAACREG